jgi:sugar/nucleoside kinase (ribokinase family)
MASDRGVAPFLRADELDLAWFRGCDWLHLAGYSLLRRPIDEAGAKAAGAARAVGSRISVDLSSWSAIRDFGVEAFRRRLEALRPDVVFGNEEEWETLDGLPDAPAVRVVKRGARGFEVDEGGRCSSFTPLPTEVVDTTGAGDALAAGFLVSGPELAAEAAARCVAQLGAMP